MLFRGRYYFLSNLYPCSVTIPINGQNITFPSAEAAFQATKDPTRANEFLPLDGKEAYALGKTITPIPGWEETKVATMQTIVSAKFEQNPELMEQLKLTSGRIVEDNNHGDRFWGHCAGHGFNHLGRILTKIRNDAK